MNYSPLTGIIQRSRYKFSANRKQNIEETKKVSHIVADEGQCYIFQNQTNVVAKKMRQKCVRYILDGGKHVHFRVFYS